MKTILKTILTRGKALVLGIAAMIGISAVLAAGLHAFPNREVPGGINARTFECPPGGTVTISPRQ